tara:strand:- start:317 stop:1429 length:1113 start_codon:yes stop_codon:yes gene_type:complete
MNYSERRIKKKRSMSEQRIAMLKGVEELLEFHVKEAVRVFGEKNGLPLLKEYDEEERPKEKGESELYCLNLVMSGVEELVNLRLSEILGEYGKSIGLYVSKENEIEKSKSKLKLKLKKLKVELPYVGIREECCFGLRKNGGLFTQCEKKSCKEAVYCTGCLKESVKNEDGYPNAGDVSQRESVNYMLYKDRKGVSVMAYGSYMSKHKLTREIVEKEALSRGIVLDEKHFEEVARKTAGRPKGQSNRSAKVVENDESDLFVSLLKKSVEEESQKKKENVEEAANKEKEKKEKEKKKNEKKEKEEEPDIVKRIEYEGKKYLRSNKSGLIYDINTQDAIGQWDAKTEKISFNEELEDLESDESDSDSENDDEE